MILILLVQDEGSTEVYKIKGGSEGVRVEVGVIRKGGQELNGVSELSGDGSGKSGKQLNA